MTVTTQAKVPRLGLMIVGLGGNNGTTLTGMILANKHNLTWTTKRGLQKPDFLGSVAMSGTFPIGRTPAGEEIFVSVRDLIPMVDPLEVEIDGWDISSMNLADGLRRAAVFEYELQEKLRPYMEGTVPRKAPYNQDFVAANQADRADNVLGGSKWEQVEQVLQSPKNGKLNKDMCLMKVLCYSCDGTSGTLKITKTWTKFSLCGLGILNALQSSCQG